MYIRNAKKYARNHDPKSENLIMLKHNHVSG